MKKIVAMLLISIMCFSFSACHSSKPSIQAIKYNLDAEPKTLDPQVANDFSSNTVILNIFEGLTRIGENNEVLSGVASSWTNNQDFTSFTFNLQQGLTWADKNKTPLTANDFEFAIKRVLDPKTNSPLVHTLYCIKNAKNIHLNEKSKLPIGVSVIDKYTIKFDLESPYENFPKLLATPPTMPCNKDFFESCAGQYGLSHTSVICNGPFKIKNKYGWEHFKTLTLVKNDIYSGSNATCAEGINFTINKSIQNVASEIKNGSLTAAPLPIDETDKAKDKNLNLLPFNNVLWALTFNCENEVFSNVNVRKGILTSINREFALSNLPPNCQIENDIISNKMQVNDILFRDVAQSNDCLKEEANSKSYLDKGLSELKIKALPKVTITCLDSPEIKKMVSNILENLNEKLDFHFNMNPVSFNELTNHINNADFQIALTPIYSDNDSALSFLEKFTSDCKSNTSCYKSQAYDKLLSLAKTTSDKNECIKLLTEAEKTLNSAAVVYPMFSQMQYFAISPKFSGIVVHPYKEGIDFSNIKKT